MRQREGWKLPTGNTNGQFHNLSTQANITDNKTGSAKLRSLPYNFHYSGRIFSGNLGDTEASHGRWWSRTTYDRYKAYRLYLDVDFANSISIDDRSLGFSLRCITTPTS